MANTSHVVDISKSYMPIDPNSLGKNFQWTGREDAPVESLPCFPYEGYNFLPTSYGYRAYFGANSLLAVDPLPNLNCDEILVFQTDQFENMLVALTAGGIYTLQGAATTWTHAVSLTDQYVIDGTYLEYTWCVIENNLYIYRQGHTHVVKIDFDGTVSTFIPSFLNMAGQLGIFRANGRLGFWDSANSTSWSSALDLTDFTPSIENMVGNLTFLGIQGRIVTIKEHGEGFIIYATKSIVGVSYNDTGSQLWDAMILTEAGGIAYSKSVTIGGTSKEHYAFTSTGIYRIGHFNALSRQYDLKPIIPDTYDFLKESRDPVFLQCHAGRYLHFLLVGNDYINGYSSFNSVTVELTISASDQSATPYIHSREYGDWGS